MYAQKFSIDFYSSTKQTCSTYLKKISTHDAWFEDCKYPNGEKKKQK